MMYSENVKKKKTFFTAMSRQKIKLPIKNMAFVCVPKKQQETCDAAVLFWMLQLEKINPCEHQNDYWK